MQNSEGEVVELYMPRKCSATNRVIGAKDHSSVTLNIVDVDDSGRALSTFKTYALSGFIRNVGQADRSMNRLAENDKILKK